MDSRIKNPISTAQCCEVGVLLWMKSTTMKQRYWINSFFVVESFCCLLYSPNWCVSDKQTGNFPSTLKLWQFLLETVCSSLFCTSWQLFPLNKWLLYIFVIITGMRIDLKSVVVSVNQLNYEQSICSTDRALTEHSPYLWGFQSRQFYSLCSPGSTSTPSKNSSAWQNLKIKWNINLQRSKDKK